MACGPLQGCAVFCRWMLFGFLISAIILSWLAVSSCHFIEVVSGGTTKDDFIPSSLGLFRFLDDNTGTCIIYPADQIFDELVDKARKTGALAPAAGTLALLILLFEFLCCRIPCSRPFVGALLMTAQICQGMSLLVFGSEDFCEGDLLQEIRNQTPCQMSTGAIFSIVAVVFYFLSGVLLFCSPRPEPQSIRDVDVKSTRTSNSGSVGDDIPSVITAGDDNTTDHAAYNEGASANKTKNIV